MPQTGSVCALLAGHVSQGHGAMFKGSATCIEARTAVKAPSKEELEHINCIFIWCPECAGCGGVPAFPMLSNKGIGRMK